MAFIRITAAQFVAVILSYCGNQRQVMRLRIFKSVLTE